MIKNNEPGKALRIFLQGMEHHQQLHLVHGATSASKITFQSQKAKHILWTYMKKLAWISRSCGKLAIRPSCPEHDPFLPYEAQPPITICAIALFPRVTYGCSCKQIQSIYLFSFWYTATIGSHAWSLLNLANFLSVLRNIDSMHSAIWLRLNLERESFKNNTKKHPIPLKQH